VTTTKSHESQLPVSREAISADADLWIRQFINHLEIHALDASHDLSPQPSVSESRVATARAIFETFLDSGMEFESVVELFGRVAVERRLILPPPGLTS
jgi:hypothetical protein